MRQMTTKQWRKITQVDRHKEKIPNSNDNEATKVADSIFQDGI